MGVEQPQLLTTVDRIERVVDVERDPLGNRGEGLAIQIDHRPAHPQHGANVRQIFQPRYCRLRAQLPIDGRKRSSAILNIGSRRSALASLPSS